MGRTVKTMIAFHQVGPICYSSLKQSNLQKDNYALAPFFIYWREGGRSGRREKWRERRRVVQRLDSSVRH